MSKKFISLNFVENADKGIALAKQKIYELCDKKTVLFLSGGNTPKSLYQQLTREKILDTGTVAMVDERYGHPSHPDSNERMIKETGLLDYFNEKKILFYSILKNGMHRDLNSKYYDEAVRFLFFHFRNSVGILGLGKDGHTAGIAPNRSDFKNPIFDEERAGLLVSDFKDPKILEEGGFGERITLTFKGLSHFNNFIILAFGNDKKEALQKMFTQGPLEEIPGRFYLNPDIARKTILITDQNI